ncbi:MAG: hypothetical protein NTX28_10960 [Novosphingobium sp.]|nr:hypothetical protein [Novosphingobium sp.]
MDAPIYPPAALFVAPQKFAQPLSSRDTSITTLKAHPAAWAIVNKEIPGMDRRVGGDQISPHLGNFGLALLRPFGIVPRDALERIDRQLRALGETE